MRIYENACAGLSRMAMGVALLALAAAGCVEFSNEFRCETNEECLRQGATGWCVMPEGFCAFNDGSCASGLRWDSTADNSRSDTCVASTTPAQKSCADSAMLSVPITQDGTVVASTAFSDEFLPALAVDGNYGTSWFSSGPEAGGAPSSYTWSTSAEECIEQITIAGNDQHEISAFRTGFGFGQVTLQIHSAAGELVFSRTEQLPGTPDPLINLDVGGVLGNRVTLLLLGHESGECGGFSELAITAVRP